MWASDTVGGQATLSVRLDASVLLITNNKVEVNKLVYFNQVIQEAKPIVPHLASYPPTSMDWYQVLHACYIPLCLLLALLNATYTPIKAW